MKEIFIATLLTATSVLATEPEAREWKAPNGTVIKYRWSAPDNPEPGKKYPLVLFLHGAGERGEDNTAQLKHGVLPIIEGAKKLNQPCYLIAPQCPTERWWTQINHETMRLSEAGASNNLLDAVIALVDETIKNHAVDAKRFYVTGISMGGYATWDLLCRVPDKIAAAIPICGGGDPSQVEKFKQVPIHAFHGEADPVVPVRASKEMIEALVKAGGKPQITCYPDVQHDSWTQTYLNPEVVRWIFEQKQP